MKPSHSYNDKPIADPSEDRFGIDPFAKALAASIEKLEAPEGTVVALNGPWGSGKSSAVNLIRHHLKPAVDNDELVIINFACWWFRGEDALALAFFRELYAGLGPSLGEKFKKGLPKLGARLLRAGSVVGPAIDLAGGAGAGAVTGAAMKWLAGSIKDNETVEKLHGELVKVLAAQKKRFVIIIDDIDRLAPDEALLIFRLVKSVGRLPNVVYLLVFDRKLAETIVTERYPSEGAHYLEKIIQAGFDVPEPRQGDLHQQCLAQLAEITGQPPADDIVRYMNVFYDVVAPEIRSPRDLIRLMNALSVTWPAIGVDVDVADFVGMETLRVLQPGVYRALRDSKDKVCGAVDGSGAKKKPAEYDQLFFGKEQGEHSQPRRALMRLFPRLESVWTNMSYGGDFAIGWSRQRRVCSEAHFDAYFRMALGDEALPRKEIDRLIAQAGDKDAVKTALRKALTVTGSQSTTKASTLLSELNLHADQVSEASVGPLLSAIFEIADELDVEADVARGFGMASNTLRIHWLLRRLTLERFDLPTRSAMFMAACKDAPAGWFVDFAESAYRDYYPRPGRNPEPEEKCLVTASDAEKLHKRELTTIAAAAKTAEFLDHRQLPYLLHRWADFDGGTAVKRWTKSQLKNDESVAKLAKAFTSYSWSQGMGFAGLGDRVAKRNTRAGVDTVDRVLDRVAFRKRVEALSKSKKLPAPGQEAIDTFLDAWRRHDKDPHD